MKKTGWLCVVGATWNKCMVPGQQYIKLLLLDGINYHVSGGVGEKHGQMYPMQYKIPTLFYKYLATK